MSGIYSFSLGTLYRAVRRFLTLLFSFLAILPLCAQGLAGKWHVYDGSDGSELHVFLKSDGSGYAEFELLHRAVAVSYAEGSRFWGTFRTTGGYYFMVHGRKTVNVKVTQKDSSFVVVQQGKPSVIVKAWLDEGYSTRDVSDFGDYKKQVIAQWKRDLPTNEDVKKEKSKMEHYLTDYYDDVFEALVEGNYLIVEQTDSTRVLKNLDLYLPLMTWSRQP